LSDLRDDQDMRRIDELLLAGEPVPQEPELTALVCAVRSLADAPAPLPSPELEQVLRSGVPLDPPAPLSRHRRKRGSLLAKITLGAAVAAGAATGAAALDLPESVGGPARAFFEGVANFFTPGAARSEPQPAPGSPSEVQRAGDEPAENSPGHVPGGLPEGAEGRPTPGPATPGPPPEVNPGPPDGVPGPPDTFPGSTGTFPGSTGMFPGSTGGLPDPADDPNPPVDPGPPGDYGRP
jgi:hypothetical protein